MKYGVIVTYDDGTLTDAKFDTLREIGEYFGPEIVSLFIYDTERGC